ncbi:MAG: biopolymer transporter ExbD [Bacteroidales bacterium]|jgi:biopolymer transport protein ExbD|nr:biopolymer transporter ExbD [Bacteroidales bacterium]
MASKYRSDEAKEVPAMSTGSMPDIIFMLIFFFMVTTSMREVSLKVKMKLPEATEIQKLEKKSLVSYIYIGPPTNAKVYGTESRIQLNDQFAKITDVIPFIESERLARSESDRPLLTTSLKCHEEVRMGLITDVKQELRKCGAFRLTYSTRKGEK